MKFTRILLPVFILLSLNLSAQSSKKADVALYQYRIHLSDEFQEELLTIQDVADVIRDARDGEPHFIDYILEPYFHDLQESLEEDTELSLLPYESFAHRNPYRQVSKKRAIKSVKADYYAKMDLIIRSGFLSTDDRAQIGPWEKQVKRIRPVVVIKLSLFNEDGKKVKKFKTKLRSNERVVLTQETLAGWFRLNEGRDLDDDHNLNVLDRVVYDAIDDLVAQVDRGL
ncbi:MAG: hypothetical protein AAGD28_06705 [Bacteroidota bacterium]